MAARHESLTLTDGSRVGVLGGGPAGSLCAFFLLQFARRMGITLEVDVHEPRDFSAPGPRGCNMCGGIVSESLVQALAIEGIQLPESVVQRGIDSYVLHTDEEAVRIVTPTLEKRIAAVHRGGGPRDVGVLRWGGLDGYLLGSARAQGAQVVSARVSEVVWEGDRPQIRSNGQAISYDFLVVATGVNMPEGHLYEHLGLPARPPVVARAYITELALGYDGVTQCLGNAMHVFFLSIPRLEFAAIIPKGEFATVCLLGRHVDQDLVRAFFESAAVQRCLPSANRQEGVCHCRPHINVREAVRPYRDRVVLVGDCGVTRLYKDGIGAAYRTAKAAAVTAVFHDVSAAAFKAHYWPVYRSIARDNRYGKLIFDVAAHIRSRQVLRESVVRTVAQEQATPPGNPRPMSAALWDVFTGSAPYRDIFARLSSARLLSKIGREGVLIAARKLARQAREAPWTVRRWAGRTLMEK